MQNISAGNLPRMSSSINITYRKTVATDSSAGRMSSSATHREICNDNAYTAEQQTRLKRELFSSHKLLKEVNRELCITSKIFCQQVFVLA